jgi:3-oxoacyl-[acyl-carrier protein] reductase
MTKEIPEAVLGNIPLGRMGSPQDVAEAAAYLATATYVTGAVLTVDGGISM